MKLASSIWCFHQQRQLFHAVDPRQKLNISAKQYKFTNMHQQGSIEETQRLVSFHLSVWILVQIEITHVGFSNSFKKNPVGNAISKNEVYRSHKKRFDQFLALKRCYWMPVNRVISLLSDINWLSWIYSKTLEKKMSVVPVRGWSSSNQ